MCYRVGPPPDLYIVLVGARGVGKSSIAMRLKKDHFVEDGFRELGQDEWGATFRIKTTDSFGRLRFLDTEGSPPFPPSSLSPSPPSFGPSPPSL